MWADAASALGAEMSDLGSRFQELRLDGVSVRVSGQSTPFADPVSIRLASDKPLVYELLDRNGIPTPQWTVVETSDLGPADAFLAASTVSCVVKPAVGGGGQAVTGHIRTRSQLRTAIRVARTVGSRVIVERLVDGDHYRFLLLDGAVLDVLRRRRPRVVGDGTSTIEKLILAEYERRLDAGGAVALKPFRFDFDCLFTLAESGFSLDDVPAAGADVLVKTATNFGSAADSETFTGPICDELVADVRAAARIVGVRLAGVDVLTSDASRPLGEVGGVVLEVNPVPGLTHHYHVADREHAVRVAIPVLEALLAAALIRDRDHV